MKDVGLNSHSKVQIRIGKGHVAGLNFFLAESLWKNSHASFKFKYTQDTMMIVHGKMDK